MVPINADGTPLTVTLDGDVEVALAEGASVGLTPGTTVDLDPEATVGLAPGTTVGLTPGSSVEVTGSVNVTGKPVTKSDGFDKTLTPTVTNGAYSAGDIMGGLLTFTNVGDTAGVIILQDIFVVLKADVAPALTLVLFDADPGSTTKTDNSPYSINDADAFKIKAAIKFSDYGGTSVDHGDSRTFHVGQLAIPIKLATGSSSLFGLLVDGTGVTLTSASDLQISIRGVGA